jgi:hypothetical protein
MATKILNPEDSPKVIKTNTEKALINFPLALMGPPIAENTILDWCMKNLDQIDKKDLINKFSDEKVKFYQYLPTFSTFGKGWLNRVASVKEEALKM